MAGIKASVNLFALLDGDDSGDKRLADFDSQHKEASALAKKKPASVAKPKKKPSPPAAESKEPTKNAKPAVAAGFRSAAVAPASKAPRKSLVPAVATGVRSAAPASSMAMATDKQSSATATAPAPARGTNLTAVLFAKAYPSARERIFKQRQEDFERRQAKAAENTGGVPSDDGKDAEAGYGKGKTHGVKVQQGYYQQPSAAVKVPPALASEEPAVAPVVVHTPPPSIDDIVQFPTLM